VSGETRREGNMTTEGRERRGRGGGVFSIKCTRRDGRSKEGRTGDRSGCEEKPSGFNCVRLAPPPQATRQAGEATGWDPAARKGVGR
jgi:hypothetical protein